jgi:medium-chain acyl-[acyl-carrier-protein] hydrolase
MVARCLSDKPLNSMKNYAQNQVFARSCFGLRILSVMADAVNTLNELERRAGLWRHSHRKRPLAVRLVFGVAHGGAGASAWHEVAEHLPEPVELHGLRLPGRESRFREQSPASVADAVADLLPRLVDYLTRRPCRFALAGACSGAYVALELAMRLDRDHRLTPDFLAVFAQAAPRLLPGTGPAISQLPPAEFSKRLADEGMLPDLAIADREVLPVFEPVLRADFRAAEQYRLSQDPPLLRIPILAGAGDSDHAVTGPAIASWSGITTGPTHFLSLRSGHNALRDDPAGVAAALGRFWFPDGPAQERPAS